MEKFLKAVLLDHVNLTVKNLDESVKFYHDLFGFQIKKEQPEESSKIIGNDQIKLCLYEDNSMSPEGGIAHFGFNVENFDDILERCESLGVEVLYGVLSNLKDLNQSTLKVQVVMISNSARYWAEDCNGSDFLQMMRQPRLRFSLWR